MSLTKGLFVLAGAAISINSVAFAAEPVSRDEIRAVVSEMLADAESRSSLLATGGTGGYDGKFYVASANGDYRLNVSGYGQFRYTINFRDNQNGAFPTGGDTYNAGFAVRRATVQFDGNVVNPNLLYQVRIAYDATIVDTQTVNVDPDDGTPTGVTEGNTTASRLNFDDIFFTYKLGGGWYVKWGQYKLPFLKEELNSETYTLATERGPVNSYFTQDRSQGIELGYITDEYWFGVDVSDGLRTLNTPFGSTFNNTNDVAVTGRAEWIFAGSRDQLKDYTSKQDENFAGYIGGAVHWQYQNDDPSVTGDGTAANPNTGPRNRSTLGYTVDGQIEGSGLSLYAAFVGGYSRFRNNGAPGAQTTNDLNDFGGVVQAGWRFLEKDEVFARWDGLFLDSERGISDRRQFNFITAGWNHYWSGHAVKTTVDFIFAVNHTSGLTGETSGWFGGSVINLNSSDGLGLLGTGRGFEGAVRMQAQVLF